MRRLLATAIALLAGALGVPKLWPTASPRRVVRVGLFLMLAGIVVLLTGIDIDATASVVAIPMLLLGLGMGALSSQLGAVTVSSVPTSESGEVGGLQNTATNLGASIGTAFAGSVLIAVLTASLIAGIQDNPAVPADFKETAGVELASGVPFLSDVALEEALAEADVPADVAATVVDDNRDARIQGLDAALAVLALVAAASLLFTRRLPDEPVGGEAEAEGGAGAP